MLMLTGACELMPIIVFRCDVEMRAYVLASKILNKTRTTVLERSDVLRALTT